MELVYGESLIAAGVLLFFIVLLGARNPKSPVWASNFLLENFHPIIIILTWFFGVYFGIRGILAALKGDFSSLEIILLPVIPAITLYVVKRMQVRKRLGEFKSLEQTEMPIALNHHQPPHNSTDGGARKRAA